MTMKRPLTAVHLHHPTSSSLNVAQFMCHRRCFGMTRIGGIATVIVIGLGTASVTAGGLVVATAGAAPDGRGGKAAEVLSVVAVSVAVNFVAELDQVRPLVL